MRGGGLGVGVWGVSQPREALCSGSEAGSYLRLIDFVYHSTLGLRVLKKKKNKALQRHAPQVCLRLVQVACEG